MIISANFNKDTHEAYKNRAIGIHAFDCAAGFSNTLHLSIEDAKALYLELRHAIAQSDHFRNEQLDKALHPNPILEPVGVINEDMAAHAEWVETAKAENRCHIHATLLNEHDECDTCERDKNGDHWS